MLYYIHLLVGKVLIQIPLEVTVAQLVEVLKLAKVVSLLLDGVVCQVDESVIQVVEIEHSARGPDVAILIEVALERFVDRCQECEHPEIKLPAMN